MHKKDYTLLCNVLRIWAYNNPAVTDEEYVELVEDMCRALAKVHKNFNSRIFSQKALQGGKP